MKNTAKIFGLFIAALLVLAACKEDELMVYDHENNVYFQHKRWSPDLYDFEATLEYKGTVMSVSEMQSTEAKDSLFVSMAFVNPEQHSDTVFLPVVLIGQVAGYDRKIGWKVVESDDPDAGVEGEDFRVLDAFIPANKTIGGIVVEIFRKNLAEPESFIVADFELVANDEFQVNYNEDTRSANDDTIVSTLTMRLKYSDGLEAPEYWPYLFQPYYGDWSSKKAFILVDQIGETWEQLYGFDLNLDTIIKAYSFRRWLEAYKENNGGVPMYEADGVTEMKWGEIAEY